MVDNELEGWPELNVWVDVEREVDAVEAGVGSGVERGGSLDGGEREVSGDAVSLLEVGEAADGEPAGAGGPLEESGALLVVPGGDCGPEGGADGVVLLVDFEGALVDGVLYPVVHVHLGCAAEHELEFARGDEQHERGRDQVVEAREEREPGAARTTTSISMSCFPFEDVYGAGSPELPKSQFEKPTKSLFSAFILQEPFFHKIPNSRLKDYGALQRLRVLAEDGVLKPQGEEVLQVLGRDLLSLTARDFAKGCGWCKSGWSKCE